MAAADRLRLRKIRVSTILGVLPRERTRPQTVLISLDLFVDARRAGASDRLEDTVDYAAVAARVRELAASTSFKLVEALAESIASLCLRQFKLKRVRVTIKKPRALPQSSGVRLTIERRLKTHDSRRNRRTSS